MGRIKIELPAHFQFVTVMPVRITDLNYGGHVGNDTLLSLIHEARMQFLRHYGYTEMDFAGTGMIMSDVCIEFKNELFYPDRVIAAVALTEISRASFALYYKLEKETAGAPVLAAIARTGMVCYDYAARKIASVPQQVQQQFSL